MRRLAEGAEVGTLEIRFAREGLQMQVRRAERGETASPEFECARKAADEHGLSALPVPYEGERGPFPRSAEGFRRHRNDQRGLFRDGFVARVDPVVAEGELEALAINAAFHFEAADEACGKVPHDALPVRDEALVADAAELEDVADGVRPGVGIPHEKRAGHAVPRAMAGPAAPAAGERLHVEMVRDVPTPRPEVLRTVCLVEPLRVEYDKPPRGGVLSEREKNLSAAQLQRLGLELVWKMLKNGMPVIHYNP